MKHLFGNSHPAALVQVPMSLRSPLRAIVCLLALSQLNAEELPSFSGETLSGKQVQLPAAAKGHVTVFCVGFTHGSQKQTKDWATGIGKQFASDPRVAFYDAAVLEDAPRFVRGMIVHGIKSAVPPERYDHFLVIYNHEKELKQAAAFSNPDDAYVLVLDAAGNVVWRAHGEVTAAGMSDLTTRVHDLQGHRSN